MSSRWLEFGLVMAAMMSVVIMRAEAGPDAGVLPAKPVRTSTKTSTIAKAALPAGLSPEDLELAKHLDILENLEVLEHWELLNIMPALEEDGDE
jgi:hypothetical protein